MVKAITACSVVNDTITYAANTRLIELISMFIKVVIVLPDDASCTKGIDPEETFNVFKANLTNKNVLVHASHDLLARNFTLRQVLDALQCTLQAVPS